MLTTLQTKLQSILSKPKSIPFVLLLLIALAPIHSYLLSFMGSVLLFTFFFIITTLTAFNTTMPNYPTLIMMLTALFLVSAALYFTLKHFAPSKTKSIKLFFLLLVLFPALHSSIYYHSQRLSYSLFGENNTVFIPLSLPTPIITLAFTAYLLLTLMILISIFKPIPKKFFLIPILTLYFTFLPPSIHTSIHIAFIKHTATSPVTIHISPTNKVTVYSKPSP